MKDQAPNHTNSTDEQIAQEMNRVAEQTNVNSYFAAELEERLRRAHKPRTNWFVMSFRRVSPAVLWVALLVVLGLVLSLSISTLIPAPQPAKHNTPVEHATPTPSTDNSSGNKTPVPNGESFDYDGAKLTMNVSLPDSPGQANVYTLLNPQPVTVEYVRSLASQLGIDGEIYTAEGHSPGVSAWMVTDGKQQLIVYGNNDYTYAADMVRSSRYFTGFQNENAETIIAEYLKAHSLDFNYRFISTPYAYYLEQLAPDGSSMSRTYNAGPYMSIILDEDGSILKLSSMLVDYDPNPVGAYRLISPASALQNLLDTTNTGGEIQGSGNWFEESDPDYVLPKYWYHDYPNDETVTIYGEVSSNPAADTAQPAVVFIDNVSALGNTTGMDGLNAFTFVQATGQFTVENGIRRFTVDTWDQMQETMSVGSVHSQGDQVVIEDNSGSSNILAYPPADLPLELEYPEGFLIRGAAVDGTFYWTSIQYLKDVNKLGGGGGGGGGIGFYPLNLSGTPVPFPTVIVPQHKYSRAEIASFLRYTVRPGDTLEQIAQTYNVPVEDLMTINYLTDTTLYPDSQLTIPGVPGPTRLDGERGIANFQAYEKPDGRQRTQYTFTGEKDPANYELTGDNLEALQKVANRPIKVWGSLSFDEQGTTFLNLEKFEVLYPDLQFQILKGTQESKEINGNQVSLFTTGGTTYVELVLSGAYPNANYLGFTGEATIEALQVPDETYAGYPALRIYIVQNEVNPDTGKPYELAPIADLHETLPDPFGDADSYAPPDITIEKVELVYVADDTWDMDAEVGSAPRKHYVQPAWHFVGRTSDGASIDFMIQALEQEYLLPETP